MALPPPKKSSAQVHHIEHLKAQREHILVLSAYLQRMSQVKDPEIILIYQHLVDLLEQAAEEYDALMHKLQKQINQSLDTTLK